MARPHPHWIALGRWGSPTSYLRVDEGRFFCGNCGREVDRDAEACFAPSFIEGAADVGCGVRFTEITSPYEAEQEYCKLVRPDLKYDKKEWC